MTDSLTQSDIDRIYNRLQQDVDLTKITSKQDLFNKVTESKKMKQWNNEINDFFYNIINPSEEEQPEYHEPSPYEVEVSKSHVKGYEVKSVKVIKTPRRYWTEDELNTAKKLRSEGLSYKQIGTQLNRSDHAIADKLYRSKGGKKQ